MGGGRTKNSRSPEKAAAALPHEKYDFPLSAITTLLRLSDGEPGAGVRGKVGSDNERKARGHLLKLEKLFHCKIRKQGSNPVELTPEGHELAAIALSYYRELEEFDRKCQELAQRISIGAGDSVMNWVVLPALKALLADKIEYAFCVRMGGTRGLLKLLNSSQLDFAIVPANAKLQPKWDFETIGIYEYCLCIERDAFPGSVPTLAELSSLDFALIQNHWGLDFEKVLKKAGVRPNVKVMCETFTHVASLVRHSSFVGILPTSTMPSFPQETYYRDRPGFMRGCDRKINLVWSINDNNRTRIEATCHPLLVKLREELKSKQNALEPE